MATTNQILHSEIFYSIQGEGMFTGRPTLWVRFFGCNLECNGFGQVDPTDPSTYDLPHLTDPNWLAGVEKLEDMPVFTRGCDSSYSWSKQFRHLLPQRTAEEIVDELLRLTPPDTNPHLCFTGGEPLLLRNQKNIVSILDVLVEKSPNRQVFITFETNGTKKLGFDLGSYLQSNYIDYIVLFSISPKLFSVSGEPRSKAIIPEAVKSYMDAEKINGTFQIKFVCNGTDAAWNEIEEVLAIYREHDIMIGKESVWIMPVGGTVEGQAGEISGHTSAGEIANQALQRGYNVSARVHNYLWGNAIGT